MKLKTVVAGLAFLIMADPVAFAQITYWVTDLGALPSGSYSTASGINNSGQVVGYASTSSGAGHAFLYSGGIMTDLGATEATGINNSGQVVGWATTSSGASHAFLYSGGIMTDLGTTEATGINNSGQVVGFYVVGYPSDKIYAWLYSGGVRTNLGNLPGGTGSYAYGINDNGQVVGQGYNVSSGQQHAFLNSGGTMTDLGTLPGYPISSIAYGINNNGQVVGASVARTNSHAFLYSGSTMTDLGTLPGGTGGVAEGINNSGQVVGYASTSSGAGHAFLYSGGIMTDLNSLIPTNSSWTLGFAYGINDNGQIVGQGTSPSGQTHAFLLTFTLVVLVDGQPAAGPQLVGRGPVTVTLVTAFPNGIILYTLDGSDPRSGGSLYSHPFTLGQSGALQAIAYSADLTQSSGIDSLAVTILPTLSATTAGGGVVTVDPPDGAYLSNSVAVVTATPSLGWTFLQWLGDLGGTNNPASLTMTRNRCVQAVFGTGLTYNVIGSGSIAVAPLTGFYPYGTSVGLAAVPNAGSSFLQWGNAASGTNSPLTLSVTNANPTIGAVFTALGAQQYSLALTANGAGGVTASPYANHYTNGQPVTVTATPNAGQDFVGWSGDAAGAQNPLAVTMNASKVITASFTKRPSLSAGTPLGGFVKDGFRLTLTGEFGAQYQIFDSTNLADWILAGTVTNTYGTIQFVDPAGTNRPARFYRALSLGQ
jgi:probable HAF family extracellular repeat protein